MGRKNIEFKLELEDFKIQNSKHFMFYIWQNLISNAIKFSYSNQVIIIKIKNENVKLSFSIKDNGAIITKDEEEKIFMPFYTSNKARNEKGTGLGLAICKKIVEKLNGNISVEINGEESIFLVSI